LSASPGRRGAPEPIYSSPSLKTELWFDTRARNQNFLRFGVNLGKSTALLDLIEHLFAVYGDGARRPYS